MEEKKFKRLIERMEVQVNLTWSREQEMILRSICDPNKKMRILEVGSGPGVVTKKICELFPNAYITCIEIDEDFANYSRVAIPDQYKDRIEVLHGDISELELEECTYDIVYARLVLQHVHNVDKALDKIYNVLKPGGKIIITDIDEGLFGIVDPPIKELAYVLGQHIEEQVIEGGDRYIGRKFWRMLKRANFAKVGLDLLPVNSDELGIQAFIPQLDFEEMKTMVDNNLLVDEDIEKVKIASEKFINSEYPFVLLVLFFVIGTK